MCFYSFFLYMVIVMITILIEGSYLQWKTSTLPQIVKAIGCHWGNWLPLGQFVATLTCRKGTLVLWDYYFYFFITKLSFVFFFLESLIVQWKIFFKKIIPGCKYIQRSQCDYLIKGQLVHFQSFPFFHMKCFLNKIFCNLLLKIHTISSLYHTF